MNHRVIGILLFIVLFIPPLVLHAAGFNLPIGGRITQGPAELEDTIACAAMYGPFILTPFNLAIPGPHYIENATKGTPRVGSYFLGLYDATPNTSTCFNPETGAPIPAFSIKLYGVSR